MSTDLETRELAALDDALAGRPVDPDHADLAELALLLRDDRPAPDPAFARELDSSVGRGFPRVREPRRRLALPRVPLPALGAAASVLLVVVVAATVDFAPDQDEGASGGGSVAMKESAPSSSADQDESAGGGSAEPRQSAPAPSGAGSAPAIAPSPPPPDGRRRRSVERSAELTLAAPPREIDAASAGILRVTEQVGGYVVSSTITAGSSGQFELRVPEPRLQDALGRLSRVARVRSRTQSAVDITGAVVSARERLTDARTERRALLRQLADADTPNETASIRARLRLVSGQIAAAKRDLRRVQNRARYSSIAVSLVADRRTGGSGEDGNDGAGWTPRDALEDALRILEVSAGVLLIALALLVPVGFVGGPAWLAARHGAQRRRERALDAV